MSAGGKGHGGGGKKKHHDDDHEEGHADERWLVTYADMVTLLMVLFIVMFAMSTVDAKKFAQLKDGLTIGFGGEKSILSGASPVDNSKGAGEPGDVSMQATLTEMPPAQQALVQQMIARAEQLRQGRAMGDAESEVNRLMESWKKIDDALKAAGLRDDVRATIDERGLVVSLVSQHVVFEPDLADLSPLGQKVVDTLAPVLKEIPEPLELDGHTNQEKVKPAFYPTDWELSTARAVNVLRRLHEVHGIPNRRLRATGFGHTKPLVDPARAGSQEVNKRVDIVVLSQEPAETRALMGEAFKELRAQAGLDPQDDTPTAAAPAPTAGSTAGDQTTAATGPATIRRTTP